MQHPIDLDRLDEEIRLLAPAPETNAIDYAQPQYRDKLPDYVRHSEGVSQIGALTAAATARMFEEAAAAIHAMGEDHNRVVELAEKIIADAKAAALDCKLLAGEYRDKAKKSFETLEGHARLTAEVTKTCEDLRKKIAVEQEPA